jgi:hypothetical protein
MSERGTNEWFGDENDKETFEPDPDREHDDWKLRQLEEEEQQKKEEKRKACVSEKEQDEVDDVDTFRQQLNQQGEET